MPVRIFELPYAPKFQVVFPLRVRSRQVTESPEREIRELRSLFWSDRDPDGRAFAPLADAYKRAGDLRQALELLKDGLDRHPGFSTGHVVSARVHFAGGLIEEAALAARRALELDGENVDALYTLAEALDANGDSAGAAEMRGRLKALDPDLVAEPARPAEHADAAGERATAEPTLDIAALAPDEPEEATATEGPVWDVSALAPDEPEEAAVLDIGALAPDEEVVPGGAAPGWEAAGDEGSTAAEALEESVWDIDALAPEEAVEEAGPEVESVWDVDALAPEEPEEAPAVAARPPEEPAWDMKALAPGEPEEESATDSADEPAWDVDALAPAEAVEEAVPEEESAWDLEGFASEPPEGEPDEGTEALFADDGETMYTRTMAELFVRQGLDDRALDVYRHLLEEDPRDPDLIDRIARLEAGSGAEREEEEESEIQARHLAASGEGGHDVDTPFTWTEDEGPEGRSAGPPIGEYFRRMLAWAPSERDPAEGPE